MGGGREAPLLHPPEQSTLLPPNRPLHLASTTPSHQVWRWGGGAGRGTCPSPSMSRSAKSPSRATISLCRASGARKWARALACEYVRRVVDGCTVLKGDDCGGHAGQEEAPVRGGVGASLRGSLSRLAARVPMQRLYLCALARARRRPGAALDDEVLGLPRSLLRGYPGKGIGRGGGKGGGI